MLRKNKLFIFGLMILIMFSLLAVFAQFIAPYDPSEIMVNEIQGPSLRHWFGTDDLGRDILSRILYGGRVSLSVAVVAVAVALTLGILVGAIAGYYGAWVDNVIMRCMDALMSFPAILLAIVIMAILGGHMLNVAAALGVVYIPRFARVVRGSVLSLKEKEFIEASRAMGNTDTEIIFQHILPNCMAPLIVQATVSLAYAILAEASLSFLGLGAPPPAPSWGNMLSDARNFMVDAPWMTIFPGVAITIAVVGFNLFGDGLRDVLDPRMK